MRHRKAGKRLGRTWEHRKALFRNMARSLLTHEQIRTTETKAKELRKLADRLITFGLENDLHARRKAYKVLENHALVKKLFEEIAPRYADVPGGYTRVVKLGLPRRGDAAPMAIIEMVRPSTEEPAPTKKAAGKGKTDAGKAAAKAATPAAATKESKEESPGESSGALEEAEASPSAAAEAAKPEPAEAEADEVSDTSGKTKE